MIHGISAAVAVLSLFSELRAAGETLESHLEHFALEFGAYASAQISIRVADLAEIPRAMSRLRSAPPAEVSIHEPTRRSPRGSLALTLTF